VAIVREAELETAILVALAAVISTAVTMVEANPAAAVPVPAHCRRTVAAAVETASAIAAYRRAEGLAPVAAYLEAAVTAAALLVRPAVVVVPAWAVAGSAEEVAAVAADSVVEEVAEEEGEEDVVDKDKNDEIDL
jgi:hypothetical protein